MKLVKINYKTWKTLKQLSVDIDRPMGEIVARAVEAFVKLAKDKGAKK